MVVQVSDYSLSNALTTFPGYINQSFAKKLDRLNCSSYIKGLGQLYKGFASIKIRTNF